MTRFVGESGAEWTFNESDRLGDKSGFGEVFQGMGPDGAVAVKRVRLAWNTEAERRRREREVEIGHVLAATEARHLVKVLDLGRIGDDLLLVMPLADGSLRGALVSGMSSDERFRAVREVVEGLVELAAASVLHRDLKPENVLLNGGLWQLADFGLARNLLEATGTYTFLGFGTLPYMAPELWNNQPATVKSDLYALGVLAYEVFTGMRPFNGTDELELRRQHLHVAPAAPSGLPAGVSRLILRLLAKAPAERPQDARVVAEALDRLTASLGSDQQALRDRALEAQRRRAEAEAAHARGVTAAESEADRVRQAIADLAAILEEGFELVHDTLPDAEFRYDGAQWHVVFNDARVSVVPWPRRPVTAPVTDDPLVAAGAVFLGPGLAKPAANVVCELKGDRLKWWLLRFTSNAFVGNNYHFGPVGRAHGFEPSVFADQRPYMQGMAPVWRMTQDELTPDLIVRLLEESVVTT